MRERWHLLPWLKLTVLKFTGPCGRIAYFVQTSDSIEVYMATRTAVEADLSHVLQPHLFLPQYNINKVHIQTCYGHAKFNPKSTELKSIITGHSVRVAVPISS